MIRATDAESSLRRAEVDADCTLAPEMAANKQAELRPTAIRL